MTAIHSLFSSVQNCEEIAYAICNVLKVSVTQKTLTNALLEHPNYPSLLAISDVFQYYGIANASLRIEADNLLELQTPFIVQIVGLKSHDLLFAVIYHITSEQIEWYNPETHKKEIISFDQFEKIFTGYVQVYEVDIQAGERDFDINLRKEKKENLLNCIQILFVPILAVIISIVAFVVNGMSAILPVMYMFVILAGAISGGLLVIYEIDQYNPVLQKVCAVGRKTNCTAILYSKGAKIFGIHWSVIGFSYFMGVLVILLAGGLFSRELLATTAWINILALPYTVYSIYYQARIARQWCPMCLIVQVVLILLFTISIIGDFLAIKQYSTLLVLPFIVSVSIVFLTIYLLVPALKKVKAAKYYLYSLQRLKHESLVFNALLVKQKQITESTEELGIVIGNPNGKYHLIKVCNPYCGVCAQVHPIVNDLLQSHPDIKLQIIFNTTDSEADFRSKPIRAFLAIYQRDRFAIEEAMDNWYLSEYKDYEQFEEQYPCTQEELSAQTPNIKAMREWCSKVGIEFTPVFFINKYQLPEIYSVDDLRYLLSV